MIHRTTAVLLAAATFLASGCNSTPRRGPKHAQPDGVRPTQLLPSVKFAEDTDGNGYYDTIDVVLYAFSAQYPDASIYVPGTFSFRLIARDGRVIRQWPFGPESAAAAVRRGPVGPGYEFRLSLLEGAGDRVEEPSAELTATFTPTGGQVLKAVATPVRIGRTGRTTP